MRAVPVTGTVIWLLALGQLVFAQVGPDIRFVSVESVEVRSGPSDSAEFYATNRLARGTPVEVTAELPNGWLQIKPPEGSFSYINTRFLRHMHPESPNHVVTLEGHKVPVYMGSEVMNRRPTVIGVWLEPGAQVISRGRPLTDEEGTWMPIDAPARERRFIRASAVSKTNPAPGAVARGAAESVAREGFTPTVSNAPSANLPPSPDKLWRQAEQAERAGQIPEAISLYARIGAETARSFPALSAMALQRANWLQNGYRQYGAGIAVAAPPARTMAGQGGGRVYALPASTGNSAVTNAGLVRTTTLQRDASAFTPQTAPITPQRGPWAWQDYRGVLRRAGRAVEGYTTYTLDDPTTMRPLVYAVPGQGMHLDSYLNRMVKLEGYAVYSGDLRGNLMRVSRITPAE